MSDRLEGADRQREGGKEDQFCQIWVHTPGAPQLDRPAEREPDEEEDGGKKEQQFYIYVALSFGQEKMYVSV